MPTTRQGPTWPLCPYGISVKLLLNSPKSALKPRGSSPVHFFTYTFDEQECRWQDPEPKYVLLYVHRHFKSSQNLQEMCVSVSLFKIKFITGIAFLDSQFNNAPANTWYSIRAAWRQGKGKLPNHLWKPKQQQLLKEDLWDLQSHQGKLHWYHKWQPSMCLSPRSRAVKPLEGNDGTRRACLTPITCHLLKIRQMGELEWAKYDFWNDFLHQKKKSPNFPKPVGKEHLRRSWKY